MSEDAPAVPQSIQARIAALKLDQVGRSPDAAPAIKKAKPPPPPAPRQPAPARSQSTNNPPLVSNGVASTRPIGNQPAAVTSAGGGPPPSLPPRRPTLPPPDKRAPPSLPPRRPSAQSVVKRPSTESISSIASGRSSVSVTSARTSLSTNSSNPAPAAPKNRVRAPEYDPSSLPPLPEKKPKEEEPVVPVKAGGRVPLRSTISAPNVLPKVNGTQAAQSTEQLPTIPSRRTLPPVPTSFATDGGLSKPRRSPLEFGMNKATNTPPPIPGNRPKANEAASTNGIANGTTNIEANQPALVELTADNFDEVIVRSGRPAFVDFYAPFCKYCKELDPVYEELAHKFQHESITIARIDSYGHKEIGTRYNIEGWPTLKWFDGSGGPPVPYEWSWTLEWMSKFIEEQMEKLPPSRRSVPMPSLSNSSPPPVPVGSRPNLAELMKSKPKPGAVGTTVPTATGGGPTGGCMKCRDFSGPDNHAARFPRQSLPSMDINWLGHQLCDPFPSATDKARAIFTWLHHNIEYNTVAFFNKDVKPSTPNSTLATGLAVCEGYAALFTALATAAGLESIVVGGHGKGFGHNALPGSNAPIPPRDPSGHAWNAVRIDGGHWKLTDPCWGAGAVAGKDQPYIKRFAPERFTQPNDEFGIDHYPEDARYFFRDDGRPSITWEEYMMSDAGGEKCTVYGDPLEKHGFERKSFEPKFQHIKINDPTGGPFVRFSWTKLCAHYDLRGKHGEPYLFFVKWKRPGREEEFRTVQTDGYNWWIDVRREELGNPGEQFQISYAEKYNGSTDGRGLKEADFHRGVRMGKPGGWRGWQWNYLAKWTLV